MPREHVMAAWGELCDGPGWHNTPVWVLVSVDGGNSYRVDCIQPENQTDGMRALLRISDLVTKEMTAQVRATARYRSGI